MIGTKETLQFYEDKRIERYRLQAEHDLSDDQLATLELAALGIPMKNIAATLCVSDEAIKSRLLRVRDKLDAYNTTHAVYKACKIGLISFLMMISVVANAQKLILTGNVSGSYDGADTICFINASGTNLDVCADVIIVEDSDLIGVQMYTGDCTFSCDSSLIPGIAILNDDYIGDEEWANDGYADVLTDSAAFYSQDALNLFKSFGVYVLNDIISFACSVDSFYVSGLIITPPGGVDRPAGGTRIFEIELTAKAGGRTGVNTMVWRRTEENYPASLKANFPIHHEFGLDTSRILNFWYGNHSQGY